jgi:transcriptional regulator with XRE-family HTH domain
MTANDQTNVETDVLNDVGKGYRTIPEEVLRDFYTDQIELSTLKQVADRAGIGRTTLHNFMNGSSPHPRTRRLLGLYYLRLQDTARFVDAMKVLAGEDEELQRAVARLIAEHCRRAGDPFPRWLQEFE